MAKKKFVNNDPLDVARQDDLDQANAKMPWWFIVIFGYLAFFAFQYTSNNGGRFDYQVYEKFQNRDQVDASQPASANDDPMYLLGQEKYGLCAACHQPKGQGMANLAPPLAESEWINEENPERIIAIVLKGLTGPVSVKGKEWNLQMAALPVPDQDLAAILTFIRSSFGNDAPPVSIEQVAEVREKYKARTNLWTEKELLDIPLN